MKKIKPMRKILSICFALVLVLALGESFSPMQAEAGSNKSVYSIRITGKASGHTYEAYQILKGSGVTKSETSDKLVLANGDWTDAVNSEKITEFIQELKTMDSFKDDKGSFFDTVPDSGVNSASEFVQVLQGEKFQSISTEKTDEFAEVVAKYFAAEGIDPAGKSSSSENKDKEYVYTISDLDPGYYIVVDKEDSKITGAYSKYIMDVVGDTTVQAKVGEVSIEKTVSNLEDGNYDEAVSSNVDDYVYFKLTAQLPEYISDYKMFKLRFVDTLPKGLTYTGTSENLASGIVQARILKTGNEQPVSLIGRLNVELSEKDADSGETTLTITTDDLKTVDKGIHSDNEVEIIYKAQLNKDAVIGGNGNINSVKLQYTNNPYVESDDKWGETPPDTATVFTYRVNVEKVDRETGTKLNGAGFILYKLVTIDGVQKKYYAVSSENDGVVTEWESEDKIAEDEVGLWFTTITNGEFNISGLSKGTFYLKEVQPPVGYNKATDPIKIEINAEIAKGYAQTTKLSVIVYETEQEGDKTTGVVTVKIPNGKGNTLPAAGGIGTTIFYVIGGILVAITAVILIVRKRMESEK
jgi:fimbrial isopeptide formation D2 family protein/LPXTG-motif cell wall-anchored protein